jgi:peroxiredoxin
MKLPGLLIAVAFAASLPLQPGDQESAPPVSGERETASFSRRAPEPPSSPLMVGDRAPRYSWQSEDGQTVDLHDLYAQGHLLLVFGAGESALRALESERDELLDLGVVPVAVVSARNGAVWSSGRKLGLHYPLVPDSRRVLAGQFDAVDEIRQVPLPSWFVVDRGGKVRALHREGLPKSGFPRLAATVLAIPMKDVPLPAHTR